MKAQPQCTLTGHLAESLHEARRNYRHRLRQCRQALTEKAVHDLRVETRRLLALLDFLEAAQLAGKCGKIRKQLKAGLAGFGGLRDTQVQLKFLKTFWKRFPESKPLKKFLQRQETCLLKEGRQSMTRLKSGRMDERLKQLEKVLRTDEITAPGSDRKVAVLIAQQSYVNVAQLRQAIRREDSNTIHKLRVAFKRFRYVCELLGPFLSMHTAKQRREMRQFQAEAGKIQDLDVLLARLDEMEARKKIPEISAAGLRRELSRRKHRAVARFLKNISDLNQFDPDENPLMRK